MKESKDKQQPYGGRDVRRDRDKKREIYHIGSDVETQRQSETETETEQDTLKKSKIE